MIVTYFSVTWGSARVPKDAAEVERVLEVSGIWEMVRYAGGKCHPVTLVAGIKDVTQGVFGELDLSFAPSNRGFIETEARSCITTEILKSTRTKRGTLVKEWPNPFERRRIV